MEFEWDESKNHTNIRKHGIDFCDTWQIFEHPLLQKLDVRKDYGERRWIGMGLIDDAVVIIVYTLRGQKIRVISVRRANHHERKIYQKACQN